jgi:hypothetical protein
MSVMIRAAGGLWQYVQLINTASTIKLPIYLRLMLGLTAAMVIAVMSLRMLIRTNAQPSNPFPSDLLIMPGTPENTVKLMGFSCNPQADFVPSQYCTQAPATGPFSLVAVTLSNQVVTRINFTLRANSLVVGDLPLAWGRPKIERYGDSVYLEWPHMGVSANGQVGYALFSYLLPLARISFASKES